MQLTKLEVKGFKSFADRVVINFDQGITGIVGPNGCGKSNVVDAIRWVLGEQKTRVLRSEKMENIIFNGTKNRKATQLAEVSLTFNNTKNLIPTEYSSVTITRKYYRSGESEYMLNGVVCRLKDINNLFMDTGISSNSYAIIELKMVDDILNDKDNSRRTLFEEAAGISKFKIRKKETLRKLEDTDADLNRVEDLLFEIEKNLRSLEKQAIQAKRFYDIKEEHKQYSLALAQKSIAQQNEVIGIIDQEIQEQTDRKNGFNSQLKEGEARSEMSKTHLIKKEKFLSSCQKKLNEHVSKIRQYESDKKIKNERQRFLNDKIESLQSQIDQDKLSNDKAKFSLEGLRREENDAIKKSKDIELRLAELRTDYEAQKELATNVQNSYHLNENELQKKRSDVFQLEKEIEIKEIQLNSSLTELNQSQEDTSQHSANLKEFNRQLKEINDLREEKHLKFEKLKTNEEIITEKQVATEKHIELLRDELAQINRELDSKENEYSLTKSLVDNLEGFPEAIKFLKKNNQWKNVPLLSDIITCSEEYRISIENYLEPYMNYYVVESEKDAINAVNLLSDASQGKAHFFIMNKLEGNYASNLTTKILGAKPTTEVIEYDEKYKKLISHLLNDVFIYEGELPSIDIHDNVVLLEKSGKITRKRFSISGGSVGLFEGKRIGRAKNLEKLREEIKKLKERQGRIEESQNTKQADLNLLKEESNAELIDGLKGELAQIDQEHISILTKQEQFTELISTSQLKRKDMNVRLGELEKSLVELKPKLSVYKTEFAEITKKVEKYKAELESINELLSKKSTAFNEENVYYHQQENKLNTIRQEIAFKQESFEGSLGRIERNSQELQQVSISLNDLIMKSTENDDELVEMYKGKEKFEREVNEAEKAYYESREAIGKLEKDIRDIQRNRESTDQTLMELQNKRNDGQLQLQSIKDRLSVEFNVNIENIDTKIDEKLVHLDVEELQKKVTLQKDQIENMGPVNPMAMEAYEEIQVRHEFITGQKEDLLSAKEALIETITEINEVAKTTFMDAFEKIHEHFVRVFRTLFTDEDDCHLRLTDPDNPLESFIEIIAKPKGKKPLTINQLSGGEKTLTATSLLFAIYLLKPAPFCIFDEVDAPLDDANIDKFNEIIRKFSDQSQFIIVTHNKRTMSSTDIIYGITMVEQGISRVVPVDLRELV